MFQQVRAILTPSDRRRAVRLVAYIIALSLVQVAAYLMIIPLLDTLIRGAFDEAWWWTKWMIALTCAVAVFGYLQSSLGVRLGMSALSSIQRRIGDHISSLPLGWFTKDRSGPVARLITSGTDEVFAVFAHYLHPLITGILVPAGVAAGMLMVSWPVGVAMLVSAPVLYLVNRWGMALYAKAETRDDAASAVANHAVVEYAQTQAVLRSAGATSRGDARLHQALDSQRKAARSLVLFSLPGQLAFSLVVQLTFILLIYTVLALALDGQFEVPAAIALIAVTSRFIDPLTTAAVMSTAVRGASNSAHRIAQLLDEPVIPDPSRSAQARAADVAFQEVSFSYATGDPVIHEVSFAVPAGTTTAIVGASGSGKTTLLRLTARFYDVGSGTVSVSGNDVRDYGAEVLMDQLSVVFQDVYLFDTSIYENILIGRPVATEDDVIAAAHSAGVDEIAARVPGGIHARVGEGGTALSGGERQRISVARALLKDAPVVLLDEATSALDVENEAVVLAGIERLTSHKTVLVVAHRLSTIRNADQILFLHAGRISERGTHEELLEMKGRYFEFWSERERATGWRLRGSDVS